MEEREELKEELQEVNVEETETVEKKKEEAVKWGAKAVTRKFLTLALAGALLLNIILGAGVNALFARKHMGDRPNMQNLDRPGSEQFFNGGHGKGGNMQAPPNDNQNGAQGNQNQQPDQNQNTQPNQNQNTQPEQNQNSET